MLKFLRKLFEKKIYVVNLRSKEIHMPSNEKKNCKLEIIADKKKIGKTEYQDYLKNDYNGCRWCNKADNTG